MTKDGCKVCRTLESHGSEWIEGELVARWRGDDGDRLGYRRLARWLNVTLLERAMDRAGLPTAGGEAPSRYDRLTGDDDAVASGVREVLRGEGVPIDELESAFVSYGVVRTHLLDCLNVERPAEPSSAWEADAVAKAREQAAERAHAAVRARFNKDTLAAGGVPDVEVTITLTCPTCCESAVADDVLDSGVLCDCPPETPSS